MSVQTRTGLGSSAGRFDERAAVVRRGPWRRIAGAVLVLSVLAGLVWLVGYSSVLVVRSVDVSGVKGAEAAAVERLAAVPVGQPLARLDTGAVVDRVAKRPTVSDVSVERSWPSTVVIHVVPRTPVLVARLDGSTGSAGALRLVDREGVAYSTVATAPRGLPVVAAEGRRAVTPEALRAALGVIDAMPPGLLRRVTGLTVSSADMVTLKVGSTTVVWGGTDRPDLKVAVLTALLPQKPSTIDVSVPDHPVTR